MVGSYADRLLKSLLLNFQTHFFLIPPHYTFSFDLNELAEKALDYFILFIPCFLMIYLTVENFRWRLISRNTQFTIFFYPRFGKKKKLCGKEMCFAQNFKIQIRISSILLFLFFLQLYSLNRTITKTAGAQAGFLKGDKTGNGLASNENKAFPT